MSKSGVAGIGASGQMDELELKIAKVIINESDGGASGQVTSGGRSKGAALADSQTATGPNNAAKAAVQTAAMSASERLLQEEERRERLEKTVREASIAALVALQEERARQAEAHEK